MIKIADCQKERIRKCKSYMARKLTHNNYSNSNKVNGNNYSNCMNVLNHTVTEYGDGTNGNRIIYKPHVIKDI